MCVEGWETDAVFLSVCSVDPAELDKAKEEAEAAQQEVARLEEQLKEKDTEKAEAAKQFQEELK